MIDNDDSKYVMFYPSLVTIHRTELPFQNLLITIELHYYDAFSLGFSAQIMDAPVM